MQAGAIDASRDRQAEALDEDGALGPVGPAAAQTPSSRLRRPCCQTVEHRDGDQRSVYLGESLTLAEQSMSIDTHFGGHEALSRAVPSCPD